MGQDGKEAARRRWSPQPSRPLLLCHLSLLFSSSLAFISPLSLLVSRFFSFLSLFAFVLTARSLLRPAWCCLGLPGGPGWWPCSVLHERVGLWDGRLSPHLRLRRAEEPCGSGWVQAGQTVVFPPPVSSGRLQTGLGQFGGPQEQRCQSKGEGGRRTGWLLCCFIRDRCQMQAGLAGVCERDRPFAQASQWQLRAKPASDSLQTPSTLSCRPSICRPLSLLPKDLELSRKDSMGALTHAHVPWKRAPLSVL